MGIESALLWLENNEQPLSAVAAIIAIILFLLFPLRWYLDSRKKPAAVTIVNADAIAQKPDPLPDDTIQMRTEAFIALQQQQREAAKRELAQAHGEERQRLEEKIEELNRRLANPEEAIAQQHARIVQLEEELAKRSNEIGGDARAKADAALKAGNFDEAKEIFAQIVARTAPDVKTNADAEYALGLIAEEQVRWRDAADHYAKAARLNPSYDTLLKAGTFHGRAGQHGAAIAAKEALLALSRAEFGADSEKTAIALNNLAESYRAMGRYEEAEPLYRQAIDIGAKKSGEEHSDYATRLNNLACLLREMGRYNEAEPLFRQAIKTKTKSLGQVHPDYANSLSNLAGLLRVMGHSNEVEPLYKESIDICAKTLGEGHPNYAVLLNNLAGFLQDAGEYSDAELLYRQAIALGAKILGEVHPDYANRLNNLATLLWETNRQSEAVAMMARAVQIRITALGKNHPYTIESIEDLAQMRAEITSKN